MKRLSLLALVLFTASAEAIPVTFNFTGNYLDFSVPPVSVTPTIVDVRFTVDTSRVGSETYSIFTDSTGASCLGSFDFGAMAVTDFSASVSGQQVWSGQNLFLQYRGNNPSGKCNASGAVGFFSGMSLTDGANTFGATIDVFGNEPIVPLFSSPDRVGYFLTNLNHLVDDGFSINGTFGNYPFGGGVSIVVPEPGTFALFLIGLSGAGLAARRRRPQT